jgi:hypothetical protein
VIGDQPLRAFFSVQPADVREQPPADEHRNPVRIGVFGGDDILAASMPGVHDRVDIIRRHERLIRQHDHDSLKMGIRHLCQRIDCDAER